MSGTAAPTKQPRPPRDGVTAPATAPAVYLPATADRPAEPAPWVLTAAEVVRLLRMDAADTYQALKRLRGRGWLKGTRVGNHVRYRLPDALECLNRMNAKDAR